MLEGEKKKQEKEKKKEKRRVYRQTQQLKAVKHPKKILASCIRTVKIQTRNRAANKI